MTPEDKIVSASGSQSLSLNCAECEEHLADFLDGTLDETARPERKSAIEVHLSFCVACAELARDARAAMAFTERAAAVDLPAALIPQILAEITTGPSRVLVQASLAERIFGRWIRPILQPRFALGVAMTALSIAMIPRVWKPETLHPGTLWNLAENRAYRTFDRAVKDYENLALVADVQSRIDDWTGDAGTNDPSVNDPSAKDDVPPDAHAGGQSR